MSDRPEDCLAGGGEMGELMRAMDFTATPLGPVSSWSQSLRTSVSICLGTSFPMMIAWGPELAMLYNDGYRPVLGTDKHPRALGQPLLECFAEIRDLIGPMFGGVMATGQPVGATDMMFPFERHGYTEETYFVFSYSPIRVESGAVGGVLTTCTETTQRVLGERRLRTLRVLADRAVHAKTPEAALREAATTFDPAEFPFALLYLVDDDARHARLVGTSGVEGTSAPAPGVLALDDPGAPWPLHAAMTSGEQLVTYAGDLPGGPWPEPTREILVLPIARPGAPHVYGFLVAGVSPRRALDDAYRGYFHLVADHLATAVANARAHEEQRLRAEGLAAIDRAKTAFFSNVSHEFRTPLTLLLGPLEDLLAGARGMLPEAARDDIEAMHRNALRLLKLVNSLLDFATIEAGRARASYRPVDLATLTRDLAGVFRSAIERAGLRFLVDCPPLPGPVHVDPEMWEKIVLNLLSNAFKFTFAGEIAVSLRDLGDSVELEVSDTGSGIPSDELPHLFERFHRVQGTKARSHEGTGIGLALVRDLARLHGGDITVASELGAGSSFTVEVRNGTAHLPAEQVCSDPPHALATVRSSAFVAEALRWLPEDRAAPAIRGAPVPSVAATAGARLLVADDNADMRDYLHRILGEHWDVRSVADGEAALAEIERDPPDLVLADVMMPRLDGFALLRALRTDPNTRGVAVMMLSARAGEEARIEGLEAGADDYLAKPFVARELVARVGSQLLLARGRRALEQQRATLYSHFMQAPAPICILRGETFVVELANAACCELWGRRKEQVVGRPLFATLPVTAAQLFAEPLASVLATGEPYTGKELATRVDGRAVYYNVVCSPLRDLDGNIEGVLAIGFDVSDEVRARAELTRTIRYNELFAGVLGHDLRNPLGAIMTGAQLLQLRFPDDNNVGNVANRILSSSNRMARMIEQILDFTRIRLGGGLQLERRRVDLAQILAAVIAEVQTTTPGWHAEVETIAETAGDWDGDRLAQVLSNLAGNAAQHGPRDAPTIVRLDGRDANCVTISFANPGVIPADLLPDLFEPFRGTSARRDKKQGLGLGLFITREIVAAHGGKVRVDSSASEGTRFEVDLPRTRDERLSNSESDPDLGSGAAAESGPDRACVQARALR